MLDALPADARDVVVLQLSPMDIVVLRRVCQAFCLYSVDGGYDFKIIRETRDATLVSGMLSAVHRHRNGHRAFLVRASTRLGTWPYVTLDRVARLDHADASFLSCRDTRTFAVALRRTPGTLTLYTDDATGTFNLGAPTRSVLWLASCAVVVAADDTVHAFELAPMRAAPLPIGCQGLRLFKSGPNSVVATRAGCDRLLAYEGGGWTLRIVLRERVVRCDDARCTVLFHPKHRTVSVERDGTRHLLRRARHGSGTPLYYSTRDNMLVYQQRFVEKIQLTLEHLASGISLVKFLPEEDGIDRVEQHANTLLLVSKARAHLILCVARVCAGA